MARCKLTRMSLRNIRKDKQYQCIVIDFVRTGVISKSKAEELLNYSIPAGLLENSAYVPDDDDEPGTGGETGGEGTGGEGTGGETGTGLTFTYISTSKPNVYGWSSDNNNGFIGNAISYLRNPENGNIWEIPDEDLSFVKRTVTVPSEVITACTTDHDITALAAFIRNDYNENVLDKSYYSSESITGTLKIVETGSSSMNINNLTFNELDQSRQDDLNNCMDLSAGNCIFFEADDPQNT